MESMSAIIPPCFHFEKHVEPVTLFEFKTLLGRKPPLRAVTPRLKRSPLQQQSSRFLLVFSSARAR